MKLPNLPILLIAFSFFCGCSRFAPPIMVDSIPSGARLAVLDSRPSSAGWVGLNTANSPIVMFGNGPAFSQVEFSTANSLAVMGKSLPTPRATPCHIELDLIRHQFRKNEMAGYFLLLHENHAHTLVRISSGVGMDNVVIPMLGKKEMCLSLYDGAVQLYNGELSVFIAALVEDISAFAKIKQCWPGAAKATYTLMVEFLSDGTVDDVFIVKRNEWNGPSRKGELLVRHYIERIKSFVASKHFHPLFPGRILVHIPIAAEDYYD